MSVSGQDLAPELRDPSAHVGDVAAHRDVRQTGLVDGPVAARERHGAVAREVEELEHEAVALEVARRHAERGAQPQQPGRRIVRWPELTLEAEAEQLLVELA